MLLQFQIFLFRHKINLETKVKTILLTDKLNVDSQILKYSFTTSQYIIHCYFCSIYGDFMAYNLRGVPSKI